MLDTFAWNMIFFVFIRKQLRKKRSPFGVRISNHNWFKIHCGIQREKGFGGIFIMKGIPY